jgi:hypothetical protein
MEFKLNEYRQGVTDEQLLNDVVKVASMLGDKYLSYSLYKTLGKYSQNTFTFHFGSWLAVLEKAGLRTVRTTEDMKRISDQEMIDDIRRVAEKLSSETVTSPQYSEMGGYAFPTIVERFGTWSSAIEKAQLSPTSYTGRIEDIELFSEIERIWISLGKQPTTTEMKKGISKYSLDTFTRRFGGWRSALLAFIEYVNSPSSEDESQPRKVDAVSDPRSSATPKDSKQIFLKRTSRNINLKIRFTVLSRDNFTCKACGRSPAKEPGVELHVDHVVPWSRGGETELDNLQTLCSKCNLGKSDNEFALQSF